MAAGTISMRWGVKLGRRRCRRAFAHLHTGAAATLWCPGAESVQPVPAQQPPFVLSRAMLVSRKGPPSLMLRLIDDYLIITPSLTAAEALAVRFLQGAPACLLPSRRTVLSLPAVSMCIAGKSGNLQKL